MSWSIGPKAHFHGNPSTKVSLSVYRRLRVFFSYTKEIQKGQQRIISFVRLSTLLRPFHAVPQGQSVIRCECVSVASGFYPVSPA
jgi:hypothetical protein